MSHGRQRVVCDTSIDRIRHVAHVNLEHDVYIGLFNGF